LFFRERPSQVNHPQTPALLISMSAARSAGYYPINPHSKIGCFSKYVCKNIY